MNDQYANNRNGRYRQVTGHDFYRQGVIGLLFWFVFAVLVYTGAVELSLDGFLRLVALLLLLALFTIVPLGLSLVVRTDDGNPLLYAVLRTLQLPAAVVAALSFLAEPGIGGALLTVPWLAETGLIAILGIRRCTKRRPFSIRETGMDAGLVYVIVGGIWLTISRAGLTPMEFSPVIVLLTAAHFHYAGFATPIIAAQAGEFLPSAGVIRSIYLFALWSVILNPILIALGITFSPLIEVICSILLAVGLGVLALLIIGVLLRKIENGIARIFLLISSLSLLVTMTFAVLYTWGEYRGVAVVDIPGMVETHGIINALGFALCGLLGWEAAMRRSG